MVVLTSEALFCSPASQRACVHGACRRGLVVCISASCSCLSFSLDCYAEFAKCVSKPREHYLLPTLSYACSHRPANGLPNVAVMVRTLREVATAFELFLVPITQAGESNCGHEPNISSMRYPIGRIADLGRHSCVGTGGEDAWWRRASARSRRLYEGCDSPASQGPLAHRRRADLQRRIS